MTDAQTEFAIEPSPAVASFSSRGPNRIDPSIIKVNLQKESKIYILLASHYIYYFKTQF